MSSSGPFLWVPPDGVELIAHNPQVVAIIDMAGVQSGIHRWDGLDRKVAEWFSHEYWQKVPWAGHACNHCRSVINISGQPRTIRASVIDGTTSCRHYKCAFLGCAMDLPRWGSTYQGVRRVLLLSGGRFHSDLARMPWTYFGIV